MLPVKQPQEVTRASLNSHIHKSPANIRSALQAYFLKRDPLWAHEKPYTLRFQPSTDINLPRTNVLRELREIEVHDIRELPGTPNVSKEGFAILELHSTLDYEAHFNEAMVKAVYYQELESAIREMFGATWVRVIEHIVRKRHPDFPVSTGIDYEFNQPTLMAHIDSTTSFTLEEARNLGGNAAQLGEGRYMLVNAWKPLKGPLHDWPLALCDASTVNAGSDLVIGDIVFPTYVTENYQVHYSERHRWFYLAGQKTSEILIFKQSDTMEGSCPSVPHTSFYNSLSPESESPRESIEARAIVYTQK